MRCIYCCNREDDDAPQNMKQSSKMVVSCHTVQGKCAANAVRQLDYAFASRGFHERVKVRALNGVEEWGPSDHCRLLIEVSAPEPPAPRRKFTVDAIRHRAVDAGVGRQFDRFLNLARDAGLAVRPWASSVTIAPPTKGNRTLMYARPESGDEGGRLHIWVAPEALVEFFPHLNEHEIIDALALAGSDWESTGGEELDATLDRIGRFLTDKLPQPDADGN